MQAGLAGRVTGRVGQVGWSPGSRQVGFYPDLGLPDDTPTA